MTNSDSPAFAAGGENWNQVGLTKREYFAAMAMQGMASKPLTYSHADECARFAVKFADALIKELNKESHEKNANLPQV